MGLGLSLISKELIKVFALNPDYWPAFTVVPIIVLAYIFSATRNLASLGLFLTKNTKQIAWITLLAAVINIGLNFWLIPIYGMMAAAYNTLFAFIVYHILTKYFSDKQYEIEYENWKIIKIFIVGIFLYLLILYIEPENLWYFLGVKVVVFLLFPFFLYLLKTYETVEVDTVIKIFKHWKNPSNIKELFSNKLSKIKKTK
jgi:O-antigen/teichoic acid export membrane protein